jgi:hypothetical protein
MSAEHGTRRPSSLEEYRRYWRELGVIMLFVILISLIVLVPVPAFRAAAGALLILVGLSAGASMWIVRGSCDEL